MHRTTSFLSYVRHISVVLTISLAAVILSWAPLTHAAGPNLITNANLELGTTGFPTKWFKGGYGTHTRILSYPITGYQGSKSLRTEITNYTSGDAKWYFERVSVPQGTALEFSDVYRSNIPSVVTAEFTMNDGTRRYLDIGKLSAASTWQTFRTTFTPPTGTASLTIFHLIKAVGFLETDNYFLGTAGTPSTTTDPTKFDKGYVSIHFDDGWLSAYNNALPILNAAGFTSTQFITTGRLKPNDFPGYIKAEQVLALQRAGHEIGAHTLTHPNLTLLSVAEMEAEIEGSRSDLLALGATPVNYFAYPYGAYNSAVIAKVKEAGFLGARSSDGGYNTKTQDPFVLKRQPMVNTTSFTQIKSYIDKARTDKTWVVLLFHQVDTTGATYAVTPALFQQTIDYLKQVNMTPITMQQGLQLMKQ